MVDNCHHDEGNNCSYDYDFRRVFGNVDKRVCNQNIPLVGQKHDIPTGAEMRRVNQNENDDT